MPIWTEIENSRSEMVQTLYEWWTRHLGPNGLPDRRDLDPSELMPLLANLFIADVEPEPFRIRYRLVGTTATRVNGFELAGKYLDEVLLSDAHVPWMDYYRSAYDRRVPVLGSEEIASEAGGSINYEFRLFPMGSGGEEVVQFAAVEDYFNEYVVSTELVDRGLNPGILG